MKFFGIIFYIIVIAVFINAKKAAESEKGGKSASHKGYTVGGSKNNGNYSGQTSLTGDMPKKTPTAIPNVSGKRKIEKTPTAIPNVPGKCKTEKTYMEPHREEVIQPKIRNNNLWGEDEHARERIVALRLMEGDPVPQGYLKIRCPYCAADNLVTKNCKQYHSCYFCRVPID